MAIAGIPINWVALKYNYDEVFGRILMRTERTYLKSDNFEDYLSWLWASSSLNRISCCFSFEFK